MILENLQNDFNKLNLKYENKKNDYIQFLQNESKTLENNIINIVDTDIQIKVDLSENKIEFIYNGYKQTLKYDSKKEFYFLITNMSFPYEINNEKNDKTVFWNEFNINLYKSMKDKNSKLYSVLNKIINSIEMSDYIKQFDEIEKEAAELKNKIKLENERLELKKQTDSFNKLMSGSILIRTKNFIHARSVRGRRGRKSWIYPNKYEKNYYLINNINKNSINVNIIEIHSYGFNNFKSNINLKIKEFKFTDFDIFNDFNSFQDYYDNYYLLTLKEIK